MMNVMEFEEIHFPIEPSYIEELHECSLETAYYVQTEDPTSPNTIPNEIFNDHYCRESLLQIETDVMDIDSVDQDAIGLESVDEMIQEIQENVMVLAEENSQTKGIQEELMEESSLADLLLTGAEAVESQNWPLASEIIANLNNLLFDQQNGSNTFSRLALFFTQGLHYKSINATDQTLHEPAVSGQTNTMSAFQMIQELSPYVKFAHFTANQAILEATEDDLEVHVIDFEIMEGIQWPPLMVDLAARKHSSFRITAIIFDQQKLDIVQQTGRRLKEFADSMNLHFFFDQMVMVQEEDFGRIEVGHTLVANCIIHQLHMPSRSFSLVKTFLGGMTKLNPKIVVLVEDELFNFAKLPSMSFVEFFCEALHHYTALSESLVSSFCGGYKTGLRQIEKELLGIRISESVRKFPCEKNEKMLWTDMFSSLKGFFRPIPMSSYNVSQAKFLVNLFPGGYWVQHEKCRLTLCWKSRPLTTASIWVPILNQNHEKGKSH